MGSWERSRDKAKLICWVEFKGTLCFPGFMRNINKGRTLNVTWEGNKKEMQGREDTVCSVCKFSFWTLIDDNKG